MPGSEAPAGEPDLGALLARLLPRLAAAEEPILAGAGLSMWEYAIMTELASGAVVSQADLSRRTGRDPTRLGRHLDDLRERGLVAREQASDRRRRSVRLTAEGERLYREVKAQVRAAEDDLLHDRLTADEAARLRQLLARLTEE